MDMLILHLRLTDVNSVMLEKRQRKLPAKYDGFIIGPLRQLSVILENKFLGEVYTEHYAQMCV